MGIRNPRILERYQNATDDIRVNETRKALMGANGGNKPRRTECLQENDNDRNRQLVDLLIKGEIDQDAFKMAIGSLQEGRTS